MLQPATFGSLMAKVDTQVALKGVREDYTIIRLRRPLLHHLPTHQPRHTHTSWSSRGDSIDWDGCRREHPHL